MLHRISITSLSLQQWSVMKSLQDKLSENNIIFLSIGVILLLSGSASGVSIGTFSFNIQNQYLQIVIVVTGILLIIFGIYLT